jgi:hypothetical protein
MALQKDRTRLSFKGLGNIWIREVSPSSGIFYNLGYIDGTTIQNEADFSTLPDEYGQVVEALTSSVQKKFATSLMQTTKDEIDIIANAESKIYAIRYFGLYTDANHFLAHICDKVRLNPSFELAYKRGLRPLPMAGIALNTSAADGFTIPERYDIDALARLYLDEVAFWIEPRLGWNYNTTKVLDCSGYGNHGTLDPSSAWQSGTPTYFLRFDGNNDYVTFGDICDDNGTIDFVIEGWLQVQGADGTEQEIITKIADLPGLAAGWGIYRNGSNKIVFILSDILTPTNVISDTSITQNVWKHIAIAVDRNGNGQIYINGVADGSPVELSTVGSATNSTALYLARCGSGYGQVDLGGVRIHRYNIGSLPSDIATQLLSHYNAEKTFYGL